MYFSDLFAIFSKSIILKKGHNLENEHNFSIISLKKALMLLAYATFTSIIYKGLRTSHPIVLGVSPRVFSLKFAQGYFAQ